MTGAGCDGQTRRRRKVEPMVTSHESKDAALPGENQLDCRQFAFRLRFDAKAGIKVG